MRRYYSIFDHTADMGLHARGETLADVLHAAGDGLYAVIGELHAAAPGNSRSFDLSGTDAAMILRDYLTELLHLFEHDRRMVTAVDIAEFSDRRLRASAETAAVDLDTSVFYREVKAITYHELAVREIPGGFEATVIVDI